MDNGNAATLEEIRRDVIGNTFTGRVVLHCKHGRIEEIEVNQRRPPPWKRNGGGTLDMASGTR